MSELPDQIVLNVVGVLLGCMVLVVFISSMDLRFRVEDYLWGQTTKKKKTKIDSMAEQLGIELKAYDVLWERYGIAVPLCQPVNVHYKVDVEEEYGSTRIAVVFTIGEVLAFIKSFEDVSYVAVYFKDSNEPHTDWKLMGEHDVYASHVVE